MTVFSVRAPFVVLAAAICGATSAQPGSPPPGAPLPEVPSLRSHDHQLVVHLTAAPGKHSIAGQTFEGMLYNGAYVPDVWRLRGGDTLTVVLENRLPETTNLHFHGLGVSPRGNSDNVFVHVEPGQSFTYRLEIPDHPGLYWFHPHAHGATARQITGGLSGGFIVEGSDVFFPFLRTLRERVMLLKHIPGKQADYQELVTVNGVVAPTIDIRPGEIQYWRVANIGSDLFLNLSLGGMAFYVVGTDAHYLPRPQKVDHVLLGPAQRIDALVVGGPQGRYSFKSLPFTLEEGRPPLPERDLGVVVSAGAGADVAAAEARVAAQKVQVARYIDEVRRSPIARRRTMVFSRSPDRSKFFINGQLFDERRTDVTATLGDVEEWTLRNEDNQLHNFHIHQTVFVVAEINGVPQDLDSFYDTFTLPAAKAGKPSTVTIIIPFTDPTILGRFVFHCHISKHADKGMMQTIEVVPRRGASNERR